MAWIAVKTLPHLKRGKLPTGVSSRKTWTNNLDIGKQMTADFGLAGAPMSSNAWLLSPIIVKSVHLYWRVFSSRRAFEMLEPIALKGARWVLRGGSGSNVTSLPDRAPRHGVVNRVPSTPSGTYPAVPTTPTKPPGLETERGK